MSSVKLTTEELNSINDFRNKISDMTFKTGDLQLNRTLLKSALDKLDDEYNSIISKFMELKDLEKTFIMQLKEKYGNGQINIDSGEFIKQ